MEVSIKDIFESQRLNQYAVAASTLKERKDKLKKFKFAMEVTFRKKIQEAMWLDFHKSAAEVDLSEVYVVTSEIKHALKHLSQWMHPQAVTTPLALFGSKSYVHQEPKGVCLIISPWNFPINLTFGPLVSAIAAGNTAILKPSEMTPHTSNVIKEIAESLFSSNEVAVVLGNAEVSSKLLELPFNHIFFTGSPAVGKIVMTAAAKNLSSVTLELGGKSPTIIDETADIKVSAKRLAWAKYFNAGQICVAPDYIIVHEKIKNDFLNEFRKNILNFYSEHPENSEDFAHVVNTQHLTRLNNLVKDATSKGAEVILGGQYSDKFLEPTILCDIPENAEIMNQEVFGPVMPVKTYSNKSDLIQYLNSKEKPLALYIYSKSEKNIEFFVKNTRAGTTCINNSAVQFFNNNLPFGGVNNSGIGKSHGYYGFQEFSNPRGIMRQVLPGALELLIPPYNNFKEKLIDLTIKWF